MENEIDPWSSKELKLDEKLIQQFGLELITEKDLKILNHYLFERKIVFAHRDLQPVLQRIREKKPFIQMTGIASSGQMHFGHKVDVDLFLFFKALGAKSHFAVSDIDAYVSRPDEKIPTLEKAREFAVKNTADLLALGVSKNEVYVQSRKDARYYTFAMELSKKVTENTFKAIYGHVEPGKVAANLLQYADMLHFQLPEYEGPMPSITGIGLDQDPHARATRDIAKRLQYNLVAPSFIYFSHQPGLQEGKKMSSSEPDTAVYLNDKPEEAKRKINKAFSGGRDSIEEHRKLGGRAEIDKPFQLLWYHHQDTKLLKQVEDDYRKGKLLSGEIKKLAIEFTTDFLARHQEKVEKNLTIAEKIVHG